MESQFDLCQCRPVSRTVRMEQNGLSKWWSRRSVPVSQSGVAEMIKEAGYSTTSEYLTANLGLSLNDYYWIRPVDARLCWKDVSLFSNDFHAGRLITSGVEDTDDSSYVTENICRCYEEKIDLLSELQHGKDPYKDVYFQ